ncbi:dihydroxyacetone kinase, partial [Streptomyces sp. SID8361]
MSDQPGPKGLTHTAVMDWLTRFAATVRSVEPELTALDQKAGDGDFGANLVTGMDGVRRALDALAAGAGNGGRDGSGPDAPLDAAARVFLDDVG